jgi:hypothetical protein
MINLPAGHKIGGPYRRFRKKKHKTLKAARAAKDCIYGFRKGSAKCLKKPRRRKSRK